MVSMLQVVMLSKAAASPPHPPVSSASSRNAVFWTYTYPANLATDNWTAIPTRWEDERARWEYSHAAGAAFQILAMSALIIAALARARSKA
jgi:hypothetical protein